MQFIAEREKGFVDLGGEIVGSSLVKGAVPKFKVVIDDDQLVSIRRVVVPRTRVAGYVEQGIQLLNNRFGLVTISIDAIELHRLVTVRHPLRPDRNPYIPLESLIGRSLVKGVQE